MSLQHQISPQRQLHIATLMHKAEVCMVYVVYAVGYSFFRHFKFPEFHNFRKYGVPFVPKLHVKNLQDLC